MATPDQRITALEEAVQRIGDRVDSFISELASSLGITLSEETDEEIVDNEGGEN